MKTLPARGLVLLLVFLPLIVQAVAPVNDKFVNAKILRGRSVTLANQTGAGATPEALDPFIGGVKLVNTVWYRFDPLVASNNSHLILTHAAGVRMAVFKLTDVETSLGSLAFVAEATNPAAGTDTLTFTTSLQTRFYICVETTGVFSLTLQLSGATNDFFADAEVLSGNVGTVNGNNKNATNEGDVPLPRGSFTPTNGVWYSWTPSFTGPASVDTNFSFIAGTVSHSTGLVVFTGTALDSLTEIAVDTFSGFSTNSRVTFNAVSGTTYRIWVGSAGLVSGSFNLHYQPDSTVGAFSIVMPAATFSENQGTVSFLVRRNNAGSGAASVTVSTTSGTATSGTDFAAISQVVNFPAATANVNAAFEQSVSFKILPDTTFEGLENFTINLSSPTSGGTLSAGTVTCSIDDEPADMAPGFTTTALTFRESDGQIFIPIGRASGLGRSSVNIVLNPDGTDTATDDLSTTIISLTFVEGQTLAFLPFTLANDGIAEGTEKFSLLISPSLSGQLIDGSRNITVTILDDEVFRPNFGHISANFDNFALTFGGNVNLDITAAGVVTGKLITAKGAQAFTGKLDGTGFLRVLFGPAGAPLRTLTIQQLSNRSDNFQIELSDNVLGNFVSKTVSISHFSTAFPCPVAGAYTLIDDGFGIARQLQASSLTVSALGVATLTGKVYDGTAFVAVGGVDENDDCNVAVPLYAGQGRLSSFARLTPGNLGSTVNLVRPGRVNQTVELPSIKASFTTTISTYTPPAPGVRVLGVWNPAGAGFADLTGGGFVATTSQAINVSTANKVSLVGAVIPSLKIAITPATGIFTGSVIPTGATTPKPIFGAISQSNTIGQGFFLNGFVDGRVRLR